MSCTSSYVPLLRIIINSSPTPTPTTHDPRLVPTTHDPRPLVKLRKNLGAIISALATLIYYKVVIYISSYVATVRCFTLHIFVNAGMKMKQSVLCLNVIDQHYLNFHLPQKEILLLLLLILYLFIFSRHCEHKIKKHG